MANILCLLDKLIIRNGISCFKKRKEHTRDWLDSKFNPWNGRHSIESNCNYIKSSA